MSLRRILLPFAENREFLKTKWWHRLFIVAYSLAVLFCLLTAGAVSFEAIKPTKQNQTIVTDLSTFSANSDPSIVDTVPLFLKQNNSVGCIDESGEIEWISTYALEDKSFCSADLNSYITEASKKIFGTQDLAKAEQVIKNRLAQDKQPRYCFIHNDVECNSKNIVIHRPNAIFSMQVALYSLLTTYLFSLLMQLAYYKGFIYIVYGKRKIQ